MIFRKKSLIVVAFFLALLFTPIVLGIDEYGTNAGIWDSEFGFTDGENITRSFPSVNFTNADSLSVAVGVGDAGTGNFLINAAPDDGTRHGVNGSTVTSTSQGFTGSDSWVLYNFSRSDIETAGFQNYIGTFTIVWEPTSGTNRVAFETGAETGNVQGYYYSASWINQTTIRKPLIRINVTHFEGGGEVSNFTIHLNNVYNGSSINYFSSDVGGEVYNTLNGTITTNILNNDTSLYNVSIYNATGYFNKTYNNINVSSNLYAETYQAIVQVSAHAKISNETLSAFGVTSGSYSNNTILNNETTLYTDAGSLEFYLNGNSGWYSDSQIKTITALTTNFIGLSGGYQYNLTITAKDDVSASSINNFSVELLSNDYPGWVGESETTASGTIVFSLINGSYNANFTSSGYETINSNITVTSDTSYQFNASEAPSINITIKDSETLNLITQNITIDILSPTKFQTNTTSTGNIFLTDVTTGLNKITFNTANYSQAVYYVTLVSDESSLLTAYLTNDSLTEEITFIIRNIENELVEEATLTFTKLEGTESITVANCLTDVSGSCKVNLNQGTTYNILIESDDYTTRTLNLQPTETSYTVTLSPLSTASFVTVTNFFSYSIQPTYGVINSSIKKFNVTASSSNSLFQWFGLKTTYNSSDYISNNTGSASGGSANLNINLTSGSVLNINYFFKLSGYEVYEFNETYLISNFTSVGNASLVAVAQDLESEGVSSFFLILLSVGLTLFAVVVVSPFVPPVALGFLSMLGIAVFTVIGWIPAFWGISGLVVSVAMIILISRGGG